MLLESEIRERLANRANNNGFRRINLCLMEYKYSVSRGGPAGPIGLGNCYINGIGGQRLKHLNQDQFVCQPATSPKPTVESNRNLQPFPEILSTESKPYGPRSRIPVPFPSQASFYGVCFSYSVYVQTDIDPCSVAHIKRNSYLNLQQHEGPHPQRTEQSATALEP